jgi:hypothetical protein
MFNGSLRQKLLIHIGIAQVSLILVSVFSLYKIVGQSTHSIDSFGMNIEQVETISHIKAEFGKQIQEWKNTQLAQDCSRTADDLKNQSVELDGYVSKLMSILHGSETRV